MHRHIPVILISLLLWLSPTMAIAGVVVLKTGQSISGEIILQNDEVVILRAKNGMRYQYPTSEVMAIEEDKNKDDTSDVLSERSPRKLNIGLQVQTGAAYVPELGWGTQLGVDMMLGSHSIAGKRMFVGGAVGYRATFLAKQTYSFIPLYLSCAYPLTDGQHSPVVGLNIGYGFAADTHTQGGVYCGANIGWRYTISQQSSLHLSWYAEWQQAQTDITQNIQGNAYIHHKGCSFISTGLKLALLF